MVNFEKEWAFIIFETKHRIPENAPYESIDLIIKELLLDLQCLLAHFQANKTITNKNNYLQRKKLYLHLVN